MAPKMYPTVLSSALVLFVISVGVRSQSGNDKEISDYDRSTYIYTDRPTPRLTDPPSIAELIPRRRKDRKQAQVEVMRQIHEQIRKVLGPHWEPDSDFRVTLPPTPLIPLEPIGNTSPDVPEVESKCPPGFQYVNLPRSCYKVVYEEHNWKSADRRCRDLHRKAHLVAITTNDENIGLTAYLKRELAKNSWIGVCQFRRFGYPDKMLWTSGRQLKGTSCKEPFVWKLSKKTHLPLSSFTNWFLKEPNCSGNKEPCIHLILADDDFLWNDAKCSEMLCPLCEFDLS